jgi:hypothetical protein
MDPGAGLDDMEKIWMMSKKLITVQLRVQWLAAPTSCTGHDQPAPDICRYCAELQQIVPTVSATCTGHHSSNEGRPGGVNTHTASFISFKNNLPSDWRHCHQEAHDNHNNTTHHFAYAVENRLARLLNGYSVCLGLPASLVSANFLYKKNSVAWAREKTIPTERPSLVSEVSSSVTNPLRPYSQFYRPKPLRSLSSSSPIVLTRFSGPRSRPTTSQ